MARPKPENVAWVCMTCDTDYGRNVKVCPTCHVVSPYETQKLDLRDAEIKRLKAEVERLTKMYEPTEEMIASLDGAPISRNTPGAVLMADNDKLMQACTELRRERDQARAEIAAMTISDQPPPKPATGDVWSLVLSDMEARRLLGIERYGTPLQANNGRDHLIDAYQEILDLAVYLRVEIEKRK